MHNFNSESISVLYHHGSRIILNNNWHDKNVICPNSKIYYVLDGEIAVEIGKELIIAKSGDMMLIPAGVKHSYHLTELCYAEKYWFHFDLRCGQKNHFDSINMPYIKHVGITKQLTDSFETAINTPHTAPTNKLAISAAVMSIISSYLVGCEYKYSPPSERDETEKVIAYIKKNYAEKTDLEALAKMAKLSPNYFIKKFKERHGFSPLKYINILRVERAKFLLEHTEKPINEIMEEVGFLDASHFSKLFRSETGYSPSKFRRVIAARKE
jgi:AraC-like DNA-binding protein